MNMDYDDECTADPGVMGHLGCTTPGCSCHTRSTVQYSKPGDRRSAFSYSKPMSSPSYSRRAEVVSDTTLKYEFVMHQTDKAILFAIKDSRGIYQQWIPRSVITKLSDKEVTVSTWFARRLYGN